MVELLVDVRLYGDLGSENDFAEPFSTVHTKTDMASKGNALQHGWNP